MSRRHCYLLVEGQQDVFFVGRLFEQIGLRWVGTPDELPEEWQPLVDPELRQRDRVWRTRGRAGVPFWQMFKPACLVNDSHCIVIERVGGNRAQFGRTLVATGDLIDGGLTSLFSAALLPDADEDSAASLASAQAALHAAGLPVPDASEEIAAGSPRTGIFVLSGADGKGGLEELLIECAGAVYPALLEGAKSFVDSVTVDSDAYSEQDMREMRTRQGPVKAVVGSMASVLKPGSTIQVSVLKDRWVCTQSMANERMTTLLSFLKNLCGIA